MGNALGRSLPWRTLEEFDEFMQNHEIELIL
jgi:hypothetical protein